MATIEFDQEITVVEVSPSAVTVSAELVGTIVQGAPGPQGPQGIQGIQGIQGTPGLGTVASIVGTVNQTVIDNTDPNNPVVSLAATVLASLTLANTALQPAAIDVTVQGYSANLAAWSALATGAKQDASAKLTAYAGGDTPSAFVLGIVDAVDAAAFRSAIGAGTATVTPAALTKVDDTNVTLALGGTPATALLQATSLTLGWTGLLSVARGGTGIGTLTGYVKGAGTSAFTASATIPEADIADGTLLARLAAAEAVTGTYVFSGTPVFAPTSVSSALKIRAVASDAIYVEWYTKTATPTTRNAYMGYGSIGTDIFSLRNEISGGHLDLQTTGAGLVRANGTQVSVVGHTHLETDITDGTIFPRLAANETITGIWNHGTAATAQSDATLVARGRRNAFEFGHTNAAGYGSNLGFMSSNGASFLALHAEHGTNANTYRTRGIIGNILQSNAAGALQIGRAVTASADNQSLTVDATFAADGTVTFVNQVTITGTLISSAGYEQNAIRPTLKFNETDQATDEKRWRLDIQAKIYSWQITDDGITAAKDFWVVTRGTGNVIASMAWGNTTDNPTYTFRGTGAASIGGALAVTGAITQAGTAVSLFGHTHSAADITSGTLVVGRGGTGVTSLGTLSKADDTNVTMTLGGTPAGALITSTSLTLGWTGTLAVARGGIGIGTVTGILQGNGTSAVTGISNSSTVGHVLNCTGASTYAWDYVTLTKDSAGASFTIGYRIVPQNSQSGNYTGVAADSAKHIYHPSGAGASDVYTIPSNASVPYDIGTVLTFINMDSNTVSIAITTDTMYLAGPGTTGSRTLAQYGMATAIKLTSTTWLISGPGLT